MTDKEAAFVEGVTSPAAAHMVMNALAAMRESLEMAADIYSLGAQPSGAGGLRIGRETTRLSQDKPRQSMDSAHNDANMRRRAPQAPQQLTHARGASRLAPAGGSGERRKHERTATRNESGWDELFQAVLFHYGRLVKHFSVPFCFNFVPQTDYRSQHTSFMKDINWHAACSFIPHGGAGAHVNEGEAVMETDKIKVLLVDDEKGFVESLSERLRLRNLEAEIAYDGEQALEAVAIGAPDVMVLDMRMPGVDGMEVLRQVSKTNPKTRVVVLTGNGSDKDEDEARKLGAFEYMQKPVNIDELHGTVHRAWRSLKRLRDSMDHALMSASLSQTGQMDLAVEIMEELNEEKP